MARLGWLLLWLALLICLMQPASSSIQHTIAKTYCTQRAAGRSSDQAIAQSIEQAKAMGIDIKSVDAKALAKAVVQEVQRLCGS